MDSLITRDQLCHILEMSLIEVHAQVHFPQGGFHYCTYLTLYLSSASIDAGIADVRSKGENTLGGDLEIGKDGSFKRTILSVAAPSLFDRELGADGMKC